MFPKYKAGLTDMPADLMTAPFQRSIFHIISWELKKFPLLFFPNFAIEFKTKHWALVYWK